MLLFISLCDLFECGDSGAGVVDRVVTAREHFCRHVGDAGELEDSTNRRAGDETTTWRWADLDDGCCVLCRDVVLDGIRLREVDGDHVFLRMTRCLVDGHCGVSGFAEANANATLFVAEDHTDGEIETTAACHDAGNAADAEHLLAEFATALIATTITARTASSTATGAGTSIATLATEWLARLYRSDNARLCWCI